MDQLLQRILWSVAKSGWTM